MNNYDKSYQQTIALYRALKQQFSEFFLDHLSKNNKLDQFDSFSDSIKNYIQQTDVQLFNKVSNYKDLYDFYLDDNMSFFQVMTDFYHIVYPNIKYIDNLISADEANTIVLNSKRNDEYFIYDKKYNQFKNQIWADHNLFGFLLPPQCDKYFLSQLKLELNEL